MTSAKIGTPGSQGRSETPNRVRLGLLPDPERCCACGGFAREQRAKYAPVGPCVHRIASGPQHP